MRINLKGAFVIAALLSIGFTAHTNAAFFGLPKDIGSAARARSDMPMWGPMAYDMNCVLYVHRCQPQKVSLLMAPKTLKRDAERIELDRPTLGPMAHTLFCMNYPRECQVRRMSFRGGKLKMNERRWQDLNEVNGRVNQSIKPERNLLGVAGEKWIISPAAGDCNDYAVTKRHELLQRGWPSRSLLLAEVVTTSGEHHLVVVVRTAEGDFLLDNLSRTVRPWTQARYQWVRVQSPRNPKFWSVPRVLNV